MITAIKCRYRNVIKTIDVSQIMILFLEFKISFLGTACNKEKQEKKRKYKKDSGIRRKVDILMKYL